MFSVHILPINHSSRAPSPTYKTHLFKFETKRCKADKNCPNDKNLTTHLGHKKILEPVVGPEQGDYLTDLV